MQCKIFFVSKSGSEDCKVIRRALARHESVNRRTKSFDCMSGKFRHDLLLLKNHFLVVVSIAQVAIEHGDALPKGSSPHELRR